MLKQRAMKIIAISIALVVAATLAVPDAQAEGFTVVGPGGGGAMFHPTVSPHDPSELLVACDMTGSYISHDGGHSWRMFNLRGPVRFFAFDPVDSRTIYAGTEALWRSGDDRATWNLIWPRPFTVRGIRMSSDHADETIISDDNPVGQIVAFAIDPAKPRVLVAAGENDKKWAVWISKDAGNRWGKLRDLPSTPQKIWIDSHSSAENRDIYVGEDRRFSVRINGKWWDRPTPSNRPFNDLSAGFSQTQGPALYATSDTGIFVSRDRGASWASSSLPGQGWKVRAIATSVSHPESAYVSYSDLQLQGRTWMGVARTRDGGQTWFWAGRKIRHDRRMSTTHGSPKSAWTGAAIRSTSALRTRIRIYASAPTLAAR